MLHGANQTLLDSGEEHPPPRAPERGKKSSEGGEGRGGRLAGKLGYVSFRIVKCVAAFFDHL